MECFTFRHVTLRRYRVGNQSWCKIVSVDGMFYVSPRHTSSISGWEPELVQDSSVATKSSTEFVEFSSPSSSSEGGSLSSSIMLSRHREKFDPPFRFISSCFFAAASMEALRMPLVRGILESNRALCKINQKGLSGFF